MKKLYLLTPIATAVILITILSSHTNGPLHNSPLLRVTGAPGENTCYFCHTAFPDNTGPGSITVTSSGGGNYVPGGSYSITVSVTQSTLPKYGFQMTPLRMSDNGRAGKFTPVANTDTFLSGGRHYIEHSGANSTGVWVIPWQAPATNVGDIRFYATGVGAQFPTGTPGDYPYRTTFTISPLLPPVAGFMAPQPICAGTSVQYANTSTGATSYAWTFQGGSPPTSTLPNPLVTYPGAGTFNIELIATNPVGSDTATGQITVHPLPLADAGPDQAICQGDQAQLNGSGGLSCQWAPTNGLTNPNICDPIASPSATTTYTLTVADVNGCVDTDQVTITVNSSPSLILTGSDAICNGDSGSVNVQVSGGTPPYSYLDLGPGLNYVPAGWHYAWVDDANGCVAVDSVYVGEPLPIAIAFVVVDATDSLSNNGAIDIVNISGGTPPYSFSWSIGETTEDIDSLYPGIYTVTISDDNGCQETFDIEVQADPPWGFAPIHGARVLISPNPASEFVDITLLGLWDAQIMISSLEGRVLISSSETRINVSAWPPGYYLLQVRSETYNALDRLIISR